MKAQTKVCAAARGPQEFGLKLDNMRSGLGVAKTTPTESEMLACFAKLKDLVPTIPQEKKISRVALLQHVIDYILDLEITLDQHPAVRTPPPQLMQAAIGERKPLGESTHLNQQSHLEVMEMECTSRPASC